MTVSYSIDHDAQLIEFRVSGYITKEDYTALLDPMQAFIDRHGRVKMIEIVESFEGFDPAVLLPGIKFDLKNISHISHVAVVSDIGWISPFVKMAGMVISTKLRFFEMDDLDEARSWVLDPPSA